MSSRFRLANYLSIGKQMRKQRKPTWSAERSAKLVKALSDSRKAWPPKSLAAMAGMSASIAQQSHKLRIFY
jgi:hypothetical protein